MEEQRNSFYFPVPLGSCWQQREVLWVWVIFGGSRIWRQKMAVVSGLIDKIAWNTLRGKENSRKGVGTDYGREEI